MQLVKNNWTKKDGEEFLIYLESLKNENKIDWARKIINTQMPILAIRTIEIKNIVESLLEGNFLSFLQLELDKYYENMAINGFLIAKINDFRLMKEFLDKYVVKIDNWAHCDLLKFEIEGREKEFYNLALEYLKSEKPFVRRVGLVIIFNYIDKDEYVGKIFEIINSLGDEKHYYVKMINAWLLCECFIKRREETIGFLNSHNLDKFTINKAISKCRDSRRVNREDKELLLKYKKRN